MPDREAAEKEGSAFMSRLNLTTPRGESNLQPSTSGEKEANLEEGDSDPHGNGNRLVRVVRGTGHRRSSIRFEHDQVRQTTSGSLQVRRFVYLQNPWRSGVWAGAF